MKLLNKLTGQLEEVADADVDAAVLDSNGTLDFPNAEELERGGRLEKYGSTGQQALGALEAGLRTATFGVIPGFGSKDDIAGRERTLREESPGVSFAAQAAGSLVPGMGAAGLATRGLKLAGAGARSVYAGGAVAEGLAVGTAEEVEQARFEQREISAGNILLYGVGGELAGRAIPAVLRRGAAKAFGSDAVAAIAGEAAENVAVRAEKRSLERAARDAPGMPKGPERDAVLARTAPEQFDRAAREMRQALDDGARRFAATAEVPDGQLRRMVANDAPVQLRWGTETSEQLDALSKAATGKTRAALENASQALIDAERGADIFTTARNARKALNDLPASAERDAGLDALRKGTERTDLWGQAAEYQRDIGRTADMFDAANGALRRDLAQGDAFDPAKIRTALKKDKLGRALTEERLNQVVQAFEDRVQVHRKWNTAGASVLDQLQKDAQRARGALAMADDVQSALIASKPLKPPKAPKAPKNTGGSMATEAAETLFDVGLGAIGAPPVAGIAMRLLRGMDANGVSAIKETARKIIKPVVSDSMSGARTAVAATALSRFTGEYPGPNESYEAKRDMLLEVQRDPGVLATAIAESFGSLPAEDPKLAMQLAGRLQTAFQHVTDNLPASVATSMLYPRGVPPSESSLRDFALLWNAAMDPESVLDDLEEGTATPAQVATLREVHPDTYQALLNDVVDQVSTNFGEIPSETKAWLDILFDADGLAGPSFSWAAADMIGRSYDESKLRGGNPNAGGVKLADTVTPAAGLRAISAGVTNRGA